MSKEKEIEEQPLRFEEEKPQKTIFERLMRFFTVVFVAFAVVVGALYLPIFHLGEVAVKGNRTISKDEVCRLAGIAKDRHILSIKKEQIAETLTKDLRIEEARAEKVFPNGLVITIKERIPVAFIACEYGFLDLDGSGIVLDAYRFPKNRNGVVPVTGIRLQDLYVGDTVKEDDVRRMLMFLKSISDEARQQLVELSMQNRVHIFARTAFGAVIRIGKAERLSEKSRQTENFLNEFANSSKAVEYVDFQYKSPFIKFK